MRGAKYYEYLMHHRQLALLAGLLILMLAAPRKALLIRRLVANGPLLAFGLFPFVMYGLVHQDSRFLRDVYKRQISSTRRNGRCSPSPLSLPIARLLRRPSRSSR